MRLRQHIHKRQRGKFSGVVGEHRNENGDARPDDKNTDQSDYRGERADDETVAAQPFQASERQGHDCAKCHKQHDGGIA